ncbi:hypothetical protein JW960_20100 [candidate division KSB1 bacterium]|nr:hypothetical protein [candidate division KSB1 bacterium]
MKAKTVVQINLILIYSMILISFQCSKNSTEPEPAPASIIITSINGDWAGTTSQNNQFKFTVDQDRIVKWNIIVENDIKKVTVDATSSVEVTNFKFVCSTSVSAMIINGEFTSNSTCKGTFIFENVEGTWQTDRTTEGLLTGYPRKPTLVYPTDGYTDMDEEGIKLSWSCSDPDNDKLSYDIYFGTNSDPSILVTDYAKTTYDLDPLSMSTTYYWKIVAKDSAGHATAGPVWSFGIGDENNWEKAFGGVGDDYVFSIAGSRSSSYYILTGKSEFEVFIMLIDNTGNEIMDYTYGNGAGTKVKLTDDRGFIITGNRSGKILLLKTDMQGLPVWGKLFSHTTNSDGGNDVIELFDGSYLLTGYEDARDWTNERNMFLLKTDNLGYEEWYNSYDKNASGNSIIPDTDGGYIIGADGSGIFITKTDSIGRETWTQNYGGTIDDGCSLKPTDDNGYILIGSNYDHGYEVLLIKTDADGNEEWSKTYENNCSGKDVCQTPDGGYLILANQTVSADTVSNILLIKTDSQGNKLWDKEFGHYKEEIGYQLLLTKEGGFIIVGTTTSIGAGEHDIYIIRKGTIE